jgi:hypothetical protein
LADSVKIPPLRPRAVCPATEAAETEEGEEVKYFTPDLLAECRSSNPDVAEAAAAKWQERAAAYRKRLQKIQHRLPLGVRQLMCSITLHDAYLSTMNLADGRSRQQFFLSFQLAGGDGRAGVQLRYDGFKRLEAEFHEPTGSRNTVLFALYDEFDVTTGGTLTHSILMTAGLELRVRFTNLLITRFTRVVVPGRGHSDIKEQLAALAAS